ncbi:hypothetical protein IJ22_19350 [Paenibacillus naphthalenovorans]|uniref:Uncharacterized protein n=1 Tax=Paenibacillus naphthalenovorans TaxID=162209 RepID=A0A0U2W478_9BACL|nr:hypothetical protein IJ22_19350 [Paenibacillus naphthalenovorans]
MNNRLRYFLGKRPVKIKNVNIYSPTIDAIDDIGEIQYNIYLAVATFNKEVVFKNLFNLSSENYEEIENEDAYELFVSIPAIRDVLKNALCFFTRENVEFDSILFAYVANNQVIIDKENYVEVSNVISELNGIVEEKNKSVKFKNKKAKELYEKREKLRVKYKKNTTDDSLGLKDILSILCNADGNGVNVFNVGQLTIYQVYEHFERLNIKEQHTRLLRVWANGYLSKDDKLPEWITKSKL